MINMAEKTVEFWVNNKGIYKNHDIIPIYKDGFLFHFIFFSFKSFLAPKCNQVILVVVSTNIDLLA